MDKIQELITVIQVVAGAGAAVKILYHILSNLNEDDHTMRNKKIENLLKALILLETVLTVANIIRSYYV